MSPRDEVAVFDASPLIFLSRIGLLGESLKLFKRGYVAESVREEVVGPGQTIGAPETAEIESVVGIGRLTVERPPRSSLALRLESNPRLSRGDRDSLVLAFERGGRLLADDAAVRSVASQLGVRRGGTLYVLVVLTDRHVLKPAEAVERLDRLVDAGWYCSTRLYRTAKAALERRGSK